MAKKTKVTKKKVVKVEPQGKRTYMLHSIILLFLTNNNGQVISWASAGKMGFRGSKKNTPYAAQMAAQECCKNSF
jgi:small subunit ribosomal protein S11